MRTTLLPIATLFALQVVGQCPFDPTISPTEVILCPNSTQLLSTQVYDSWQWYKDGNPIPGATAQTYMVSSNDTGSEFTVACTLAGCTEMSPSVLVDGWVFLLPYVIHGGDEPYQIGFEGESYFCDGDTMLLTLGEPYTAHIIWTNNGVPIPGETQTVLVITETGNYSASAAPGICPDYVLDLGVTIPVFFTPNAQPAIVADAGQLCVYPTGNSTQWYLNGAPIGTTDCIEATEPGVYAAFVDYDQPCQIASEPYLITGIGDANETPWKLTCAADQLTVHFPRKLTESGRWTLLDAQGRRVAGGRVPTQGTLRLDLGDEANGVYLFQVGLNGNVLGRATRFALIH